MSTEEQPVRVESNNRRRRNAKDGEEGVEIKPKREYPPNIPVDADQIGKTLVGVIDTIVLRGQRSFGFVVLGTELSKPGESCTKVYFGRTFILEDKTKILLRRGYAVEFIVEIDDKDRQVAKIIKLTDEGTAARIEREAAIAAKRTAAPPKPEKADTVPQTEETTEKKTVTAVKKRKSTKPARNVTLKVKHQGTEEEGSIEVDLNRSVLLNKLRFRAAKALNLKDEEFSLYLPSGEFLTAKLLKNTDTIVLGPKKVKEVQTAE